MKQREFSHPSLTPPRIARTAAHVPFKASIEFMLLAWNGGEMLDARRAHEARNGE
jgi:hypothetical protein